jgi:hypothetical protein
MGLSDKLKDLQRKAEDAAAEHKDQIKQTVQKVGEATDQRTGGKYSERIQKMSEKAGGLADRLGDSGTAEASPEAQDGSASEPAPE